MPCWFFDRSELENTPSLRSGVDARAEEKYRREGAKLMIDAGSSLGLRYDVCATAAVYFHRFYMFHSFTDFHRYVVASSCLFLAAKMDESNVTCDAVISAVKSLLTSTQFSVFREDPKQEILAIEKVLVEGLRFDLLVELPYTHLLKFIKLLQGESATIEQLLKMSWTFVNDSLCTTLCVEWEPDLIAISLLYLSCRLMKFDVDSWVDKPAGYTGKWYRFFVSDVNLKIIENVCHQILDLYAGRGPRTPKQRLQSPPPKAGLSKSPPRRESSSMSISPPDRRSVDEGKSQERRQSRSASRRRSRSRSRSRHRENATYIHLGTGEMLTREEFERLQHVLRMESRLATANQSTFTAPASQFPQSIPVQHPPPVIYPAPVTPSGQHLPLPGTVILTHQPMMMPPQLHEQPRPLPAPDVQPQIILPTPTQLHEQPRPLPALDMQPQIILPPPTQLHEQPRPLAIPDMRPVMPRPAPPLEVYRDPQLGVPMQVPVGQPLPAPGAFQHAPPTGSTFMMPPGNPQIPARLPAPPSTILLQPR